MFTVWSYGNGNQIKSSVLFCLVCFGSTRFRLSILGFQIMNTLHFSLRIFGLVCCFICPPLVCISKCIIDLLLCLNLVVVFQYYSCPGDRRLPTAEGWMSVTPVRASEGSGWLRRKQQQYCQVSQRVGTTIRRRWRWRWGYQQPAC